MRRGNRSTGQSTYFIITRTRCQELHLQEDTAKYAEMLCLQENRMNGWPEDCGKCPQELLLYWLYQDEMPTADGLVIKGTRIVIPQKQRRKKIEKLHVFSALRSVAREQKLLSFGFEKHEDIDDIVSLCEVCQKHQPSQPAEPLQPHPYPVQPSIKVGADMCSVTGKNYLIAVSTSQTCLMCMKLNSKLQVLSSQL